MSGLQIIDSKERKSCLDIENGYRNVQYLMINVEDLDGDTSGMLYAVSKEPSSFGELVDLENRFQEQGVVTIIGGEYNNSIFTDIGFVSVRKVDHGQQQD